MTHEQHTQNWNEALNAAYFDFMDMLRAVSREDAPKLWAEGDRLKADYKTRNSF